MSGLLNTIRDELPNKEFRENYVGENVRRGVAYQIRALREARGWTPAEFSRQAGKPQSNISRWEDPNYGKFNLSTLIEIASVFDVALSVRFVGFESLLSSLGDLRPAALAVPSFKEEREHAALQQLLAQSDHHLRLDEKVTTRLEEIASKPIINQQRVVEDADPYDPLLGGNMNRLIGQAPRKERSQPRKLGEARVSEAWMS